MACVARTHPEGRLYATRLEKQKLFRKTANRKFRRRSHNWSLSYPHDLSSKPSSAFVNDPRRLCKDPRYVGCIVPRARRPISDQQIERHRATLCKNDVYCATAHLESAPTAELNCQPKVMIRDCRNQIKPLVHLFSDHSARSVVCCMVASIDNAADFLFYRIHSEL